MRVRRAFSRTAAYNAGMADPLYFSLWFPRSRFQLLPQKLVSVMRQLPAPQVHAATVFPLDWQEAPVFQRIYGNETTGAVTPEEAVAEATELLHDDYAYEFEMHWKLWVPESDGLLDPIWQEETNVLRVTGLGPEFDQGSYEQNGHIRIDLGMDTPFLCEDAPLDEDGQRYLQQNIQQLVAFTKAVEKNCGAETRLLWTENEENVANKLIARLQKSN
jgi:hypothetical protein